MKACPNEYPDSEKSLPRVDSAYFVEIEGKQCIINREDESGPINDKVLEKIIRYRRLLEYAFDENVISVITTPRRVDESLITIELSITTSTDIIVISYPTFNGSETLSTIKDKIEHENVLTNVKGMTLIMLEDVYFRKCRNSRKFVYY